jgi:hypothetical protein
MIAPDRPGKRVLCWKKTEDETYSVHPIFKEPATSDGAMFGI